jgi:hypothetical protein
VPFIKFSYILALGNTEIAASMLERNTVQDSLSIEEYEKGSIKTTWLLLAVSSLVAVPKVLQLRYDNYKPLSKRA